ncbi:unnamed protein product [Amoebophrya sp. A25]|nr:unnamed protein product [Amoebophrya sp. A25]|eukprot:GSA25T00016976001.1
MPLPEGHHPKGYTFAKGLASPAGWDYMTAYFPYSDDPRSASQKNHWGACLLRFQQFCRCARELGEEHPRCRYQYFRAECNCYGGKNLFIFMFLSLPQARCGRDMIKMIVMVSPKL